MKKILFLPLVMALLMICACGNKTGGATDGTDSTAILDSIAQADSLQRADSIRKADSTAVTAYLTSLYDLVLNQKGNGAELTSHFSASVKKRLVAANEYDDGGMNLAELRTGNQDGPSNKSKLTGITRDGEWYVVSYSDMGTSGSTRLKAEVSDGKVVITDYQRAEVKQSQAHVSAKDKEVAEFEELVSEAVTTIKKYGDDDLDLGHQLVAINQQHKTISGLNAEQQKRVDAAWNRLCKLTDMSVWDE